jgi:RNA polymerase sigma-70 factor (ECF subfamily)
MRPVGQLVRDGRLWETRASVNDAESIERSLSDGVAFAGLFDRHYGAIHRFLVGRVGPDLADDLASETFAVAFRRRAVYDLSREDARPWLYGIATNLLRDHRRGEERRLRAYALAASGLVESETVIPRLDGPLAAALLGLSVEERNVILLHAWAELSYEQLAEALSLPVGTVRSRLFRTREKLRARLAMSEPAGVVGGGPS